jgi:hypothetical protein
VGNKLISILCCQPERVQPLVDLLKAKNLDVRVQKSSGDFFKELTELKPYYVMISYEMDDMLGKIFPRFIQRRFKIPVLLFHESSDQILSKKRPAYQENEPGIVQLKEADPAKALAEINSFEETLDPQLPVAEKAPVSDGSDRLVVQETMLKALSEKIKPEPEPLKGDNGFKISCLKIKDPSGAGFFVIFVPQNSIAESVEQVYQEIEQEVAIIKGPSLEKVTTAVDEDFYQKIQSKSDKFLSGKWGTQEISIAYFRNAAIDNPEDFFEFHGGAYLVPVRNWMTKIPLPFNSYIYLEENNKVYLYLKAGAKFPEKNLEKFNLHEQKLMIEAAQIQFYVQHHEIHSLCLP